MGMYDATSAARAEVVPAASYLRAGIHNVRFTGVEKELVNIQQLISLSRELMKGK